MFKIAKMGNIGTPVKGKPGKPGLFLGSVFQSSHPPVPEVLHQLRIQLARHLRHDEVGVPGVDGRPRRRPGPGNGNSRIPKDVFVVQRFQGLQPFEGKAGCPACWARLPLFVRGFPDFGRTDGLEVEVGNCGPNALRSGRVRRQVVATNHFGEGVPHSNSWHAG